MFELQNSKLYSRKINKNLNVCNINLNSEYRISLKLNLFKRINKYIYILEINTFAFEHFSLEEKNKQFCLENASSWMQEL